MKKRKRKHRILRLHEGDDLVLYSKNHAPIKLVGARFNEFQVSYDPLFRGWVKLDLIDIKQYRRGLNGV